MLSSIYSIKNKGFYSSSFSFEQQILHVNITNLIPHTNYSVYCYSEDFALHAMDIDNVLLYHRTFLTTSSCCNQILFSQNNPNNISLSMYNSNKVNQMMSFSLSSVPIDDTTTVELIIAKDSSCMYTGTQKNANVPSIHPRIFNFGPTNPSLKRYFIVNSTSFGCFLITAKQKLTYPLKDTESYKSSETHLTILPINITTPSPHLKSAYFSPDGMEIIISFSIPTDRGAFGQDRFNCSLVLYFLSSDQTLCHWINDIEVSAIYISSEPLATSETVLIKAFIGDLVSLSQLVQIKPQCHRDDACIDTQYEVSLSEVTISPPIFRTSPFISLVSSSRVSRCADIIMDPTSSYGSGGRPWSKISWTVSSIPFHISAENIEKYLNTKFNSSTSQIVTIPNSLISNVSYSISLSLENFLGYESATVTTIGVRNEVAIPTIKIEGSSIIHMNNSDLLTLYSSIILPNCISSYSSNPSLTITWKLYREYKYLSTFTSQSANPRSFTIFPYQLDPATSYTVEVTVSWNRNEAKLLKTYSSLQLYSKSKVTILVGEAPIYAVIEDGSLRKTVDINQPFISISPLSSRDLNYPQDSPLAKSDLIFNWHCLQIAPVFSGDCPFPLVTSNGSLRISNSPVVLQPNASYQISLFVSKSTSDGITSTSLIIDTIDSSPKEPFIDISFSLNTNRYKINPAERFPLQGSLLSKNESSQPLIVALQWTSPELSDLASLIYSSNLQILMNSYFSFELSIPPNTLLNGFTYTFVLKANVVRHNTMLSSWTSSILIEVNSPPFGGYLVVSPNEGFEYSTEYFFLTLGWADDPSDYPLKYLISYYVNSVLDIVKLNSLNTAPTAVSLLPRGLDLNFNFISGLVEVFDIYNCSSTSTSPIKVRPSENASDSTALLLHQLKSSDRLMDIPRTILISQMIAHRLNPANCTYLPANCSALNREPCEKVTSTCGRCTNGYLSAIMDDSNTLCHRSNEMKQLGQSCSSSLSSFCISGYCNNGVCKQPISSKSCPKNCRGKGVCSYFEIQGGKNISSCAIGNGDCFAKCICRKNYYGNDCSVSNRTYSELRRSKEYLTLLFERNIAFQDLSLNGIRSRISFIKSLLIYTDDISDVTLESIVNILLASVIADPTIAGHDSVMSNFINVISSVLSRAQNLRYLGLLDQIFLIVNYLSLGNQMNSGVGELPTNVVTDYLRFSSSKLYVSELNSSQSTTERTFTLPQSDYDILANSPQSTITVNAAFPKSHYGNNIVGVTILQYRNNPNEYITNSSSVQLQLKYLNSEIPSDTSFKTLVVLQNNKKIEYLYHSSGNISVECSPTPKPYQVDVNCTDGTRTTATCPGEYFYGYVLVQCPVKSMVPICDLSEKGSSLSVSSASQCNVLYYDEYSTTCECSHDSISSSRRLSSSQSSLFSVEYFSSYHITGRNFNKQWKSLGILFVEPVKYNDIIYNALLALAAIAASSLIILIFLDIWQYCKQSRADIIGTKKSSREPVSYIHSVRTFRSFFNTLVPYEFQQKPWLHVFFRKLFDDHDWMNLFGSRRHDLYAESFEANVGLEETKIMKLIMGVGRILSFMFVATLFIRFFYTDDGKCQKFTTEVGCLAEISFDMRHTLCAWNTPFRSCAFNTPDSIFLPLVLLTIIVTVASSPIDKLIRFSVINARLFIKKFSIRDIIIVDAKISPSDDNPRVNKNKQKIETESNKSVEEFGDEMKECQSNGTTLLRCARLMRMRSNIDFVLPEEELEYLLSNSKKESWFLREHVSHFTTNVLQSAFYWFKSYRYTFHEFGDPMSASQFMHHADATTKDIVVSKLISTRKRGERIKAKMKELANDRERDRFLIQMFIIDYLPTNSKRAVSRHFFFSQQLVNMTRAKQWYFHILGLILLPAIFLCLGYVITTSVQIPGSKSVDLWLIVMIFAVLEDIFLIQPLRVYVKWILIAGVPAEEIAVLFDTLVIRAKSLLLRRRGLSKNISSLIQYFNPACRAARYFPWLPISRILIVLTDFDLPMDHRIKNSNSNKPIYDIVSTNISSPLIKDRLYITRKNMITRLVYITFWSVRLVSTVWANILATFVYLRTPFQNALIEIFLSIIINGFLLALFYTSDIQPAIALAIILGVVGLALFIRFRHLLIRETAEQVLERRRKLNRIRKSKMTRLKKKYFNDKLDWQDDIPIKGKFSHYALHKNIITEGETKNEVAKLETNIKVEHGGELDDNSSIVSLMGEAFLESLKEDEIDGEIYFDDSHFDANSVISSVDDSSRLPRPNGNTLMQSSYHRPPPAPLFLSSSPLKSKLPPSNTSSIKSTPLQITPGVNGDHTDKDTNLPAMKARNSQDDYNIEKGIKSRRRKPRPIPSDRRYDGPGSQAMSNKLREDNGRDMRNVDIDLNSISSSDTPLLLPLAYAHGDIPTLRYLNLPRSENVMNSEIIPMQSSSTFRSKRGIDRGEFISSPDGIQQQQSTAGGLHGSETAYRITASPSKRLRHLITQQQVINGMSELERSISSFDTSFQGNNNNNNVLGTAAGRNTSSAPAAITIHTKLPPGQAMDGEKQFEAKYPLWH